MRSTWPRLMIYPLAVRNWLLQRVRVQAGYLALLRRGRAPCRARSIMQRYDQRYYARIDLHIRKLRKDAYLSACEIADRLKVPQHVVLSHFGLNREEDP